MSSEEDSFSERLDSHGKSSSELVRRMQRWMRIYLFIYGFKKLVMAQAADESILTISEKFIITIHGASLFEILLMLSESRELIIRVRVSFKRLP